MDSFSQATKHPAEATYTSLCLTKMRSSYQRGIEIRDLLDSFSINRDIASLVIKYAELSPVEILRILFSAGPLAFPIQWRICSSTLVRNDPFNDVLTIKLHEDDNFTLKSAIGVNCLGFPLSKIWSAIYDRYDEMSRYYENPDVSIAGKIRSVCDEIELASKGYFDSLFDMVIEY